MRIFPLFCIYSAHTLRIHPTLDIHSKYGAGIYWECTFDQELLSHSTRRKLVWFQLRRIRVLNPKPVRYNLYTAYPA